jgi:amino acid transporter
MEAGFGATGFGRALSATISLAFNVSLMASAVIIIGMVARLPMVAGWDGLLPRWWTDLHPRFRTPSKAIGAVAACILFLGVLSLFGDNNQEAVQVGISASIGGLCIMYMLLFSVILFGFRKREWRPGIGIRIGALAAFLAALVSLIFEIVPLSAVASRAIFAAKVTAVLCAANALGAYLYWRGARSAKLM